MSISKHVNIVCPSCNLDKDINVPQELFETKKLGLIKVQVEKGICCDHQFIAFFTQNGSNAGYEKLDFAINLEKTAATVEKVHFRDLLKLYGDYAVQNVLHSVIIDMPITLLHTKYEPKNLAPLYNRFFAQFFPQKYQNPMLFTWYYDLEYKKKPTYDTFVITTEGYIKNTPWRYVEMAFEKNLIKKAMDIIDDDSQNLLVQQEFQNLFDRCEALLELVKGWKKITDEAALVEIQKYYPDVDFDLFDLLLQILQYRFKADISCIKIQKKRKRR
ncbi:MAG: hypothetical protein ACTSYI_12980 [Promethearchaeota archaeon]